MKKILIIKTGHSETFCEMTTSDVCSLGDVFRTTFILNFFKDLELDWLTDRRALGLLNNLNEINRVICLDEIEDSNFSYENYDTIINLEKDPSFLNLSGSYGFHLVENELSFRLYPSKQGIQLSEFEQKLSFNSSQPYQLQLSCLLGQRWQLQDYNFICNSEDRNTFDIGFNYKAGSKWPQKELPLSFWKELESVLSTNYTISWQEGFDDISLYIKWINSCKKIITLDSLGLHLAIALKKDVISLFGPTNPDEIELYNRGVKLSYGPNLIDEIIESLNKSV